MYSCIKLYHSVNLQENLCGTRGLIAGTNEQTFEMQLPVRLRKEYQKVLVPLYANQVKKILNGNNNLKKYVSVSNVSTN